LAGFRGSRQGSKTKWIGQQIVADGGVIAIVGRRQKDDRAPFRSPNIRPNLKRRLFPLYRLKRGGPLLLRHVQSETQTLDARIVFPQLQGVHVLVKLRFADGKLGIGQSAETAQQDEIPIDDPLELLPHPLDGTIEPGPLCGFIELRDVSRGDER
jgi:hypothetical protein